MKRTENLDLMSFAAGAWRIEAGATPSNGRIMQ
jgi:hypothetical protein